LSKNKKYNNVCEVERLVDEIILKNKEKLEKTYLNSINSDGISPKNIKNNGFFYIKKDEKNKHNKQEDLSNTIISQARDNLGEKPLEKKYEKKIPKLQIKKEKTDDEKAKIRFRLGKKSKNYENQDKLQKAEDLLTSDDFNKVVSEIEKESSLEYKQDKDEESKFLDKKIKNEEQKQHEIELSNNAEKSASDLAKKHGFFDTNAKNDAVKTQKTQASSLEEDTGFSEDENYEAKSLDQNIEKTYAGKTGSDTYNQSQTFDFKPKKKSFFKKKNSNKQTEYINDYTKEESSDVTPVFKPRFKVENIPNLKDDEKIIIDEGIKKNTGNISEKNDFDKVEQKAHKLFEEHVKDLNVKNFEKQDEEYTKKDISLEASDSKNEHVFFDENIDNSDFNGWSPHLTEKERKELKDLAGEIDSAPIGEINDIELPKEVLSVKSVKLSELGFSESEWEELDFYPLVEPYAYVELLREKETLEKCYFLVEAELSQEEQQTMDFINDTISNITIDTEDFEAKGDDEYLAENINKVIKEYNLKITSESFYKILYYLSKASLGLGKIDPLMKDPNIEDISCDGPGAPLFLYHRQFGSLKSNIQFDTADDLNSFVYRLAQKCGKHISIAEPMLDATMPDGSRIQMTLSDEITAKGSTFTIRKFRADPFSPPDLVEFNTMSSEMIAYMWMAVENGINMLFAGGTASGKTTSLNALSLFIPPEAKVVSIEETREINLPHTNWIPGVARTGFGQVVADKAVGEIDLYDLMKAALRQRPEYILVGEIRGREAYVLFQAMATGHATYSTVHADSAHSLIHRLEGKPINIPRVMLQSLDVVSLHVITRVKGKRARRCKQVIEIIDIDPTTKEILTNEVFRWDPVEDKFTYSGKSYVLERIRAEKDMNREDMTQEIKRRKAIVDLMNKGNIRSFREVARLVSRYCESPDQTLKELEKVVK
jgi:type IV secretory pathway ATPase VirB11/archaellum biosynthesis ATPase